MALILPDAQHPATVPTTGRLTRVWHQFLVELSRVVKANLEGGAVNVKTFGAGGRGLTNDTTAILAAIAFASARGYGSVYFPSGTYFLSQPMVITSDYVNLVGDGAGASRIILTDGANCNMIEIGNAALYTQANEVRGLLLYGSRATNATGHIIKVVESIRVRIHGCEIREAAEDCIHMSGAQGPWCAYPTITDNYITGADAHGVHVELGCYNSIVANNIISRCGSPGGTPDVTLAGVCLENTDSHKVNGNHFDENATGLRIDFCHDVTANGNTFINQYRYGINFAALASSEVSIHGNNFENYGFATAAAYYHLRVAGDRNVIVGNTIGGSTTLARGVSIESGDRNVIAANTIRSVTTAIVDGGTNTQSGLNV